MQASDHFREELNRIKSEPRRSIHSFHRYFGKFIPAIPAAAISAYTDPGDLVIDVFAGSGTSLVEARESGRLSVGLDKNPLATFVSSVKTTHVPMEDLLAGHKQVKRAFETIATQDIAEPLPYVVNIDHWFRPEVLDELLRLRAAIDTLAVHPQVYDFFRACFSAFIRGVSNADPQHVFPGYSKRMRALDKAGRTIDVARSFDRAFKKRASAVDQLQPKARTTSAFTADARQVADYANNAALAVINPPYISSIRYLETMKIEMGWLGVVTSRAQYLAMDREMLGTERFYKADLTSIDTVGISEVDGQVARIWPTSPKLAKTLSEYFINLRPSLLATCAALREGGHLVIKISDTNLRGEVIRTGAHMKALCESAGMRTIHDFSDEYAANSRSLLTARNSYSGLMTKDQILVLQKAT